MFGPASDAVWERLWNHWGRMYTGGGESLGRKLWGLLPSPGFSPTCVLSPWCEQVTLHDPPSPTMEQLLPWSWLLCPETVSLKSTSPLLSCFRQAFCYNEWEKKPRYKTRMKSTVIVARRLMCGSWAWLVEKWGRFQSCRQEEHSESTEKMDCCAGSSGGQIPREMNTINTQVMTSQKGDKDSWRLGWRSVCILAKKKKHAIFLAISWNCECSWIHT